MKKYLTFILLLCGFIAKSQSVSDTSKTKGDFASLEALPEYPGGYPAFGKYISSNIQFPEVARVLGIGGKVAVSFVIEKDGSIVEVKPLTCVGAGCEAEAVRIVSNSPKWKPGILNNRPVRVAYSLPISFPASGGTLIFLDNLRKSEYGFIFNIESKDYLIDDAEKILGPNFEKSFIESAEKYPYPEKYSFIDKKAVYYIKLKPGSISQ